MVTNFRSKAISFRVSEKILISSLFFTHYVCTKKIANVTQCGKPYCGEIFDKIQNICSEILQLSKDYWMVVLLFSQLLFLLE